MSSFMDVPGVKANELDAKVAAKVADGASATRAQLNTIYAPNTLDGGNATSVYTGTFNFDGGSAT